MHAELAEYRQRRGHDMPNVPLILLAIIAAAAIISRLVLRLEILR